MKSFMVLFGALIGEYCIASLLYMPVLLMKYKKACFMTMAAGTVE